MKSMIRLSVVSFLMMLVAREAIAAEGHALLAKPGKPIFEDDFSRDEMKPKWKVGKGLWSVKDGVVTSEEVPADKHGAYAYIEPPVEYKDVVAEFSFKFD